MRVRVRVRVRVRMDLLCLQLVCQCAFFLCLCAKCATSRDSATKSSRLSKIVLLRLAPSEPVGGWLGLGFTVWFRVSSMVSSINLSHDVVIGAHGFVSLALIL